MNSDENTCYYCEGSIRQRIAKTLKETDSPLTADEIAQIVGIDVREVYEHLTHIARTIRRQSNNTKALFMIPSRCRKCGHIFSDLDKPKKPSRCPRCKSEWIDPPKFIIRSRE